MADVFGEDAGVGARTAIGTNSLPGNIAVEIECISKSRSDKNTNAPRITLKTRIRQEWFLLSVSSV